MLLFNASGCAIMIMSMKDIINTNFDLMNQLSTFKNKNYTDKLYIYIILLPFVAFIEIFKNIFCFFPEV